MCRSAAGEQVSIGGPESSAIYGEESGHWILWTRDPLLLKGFLFNFRFVLVLGLLCVCARACVHVCVEVSGLQALVPV